MIPSTINSIIKKLSTTPKAKLNKKSNFCSFQTAVNPKLTYSEIAQIITQKITPKNALHF